MSGATPDLPMLSAFLTERGLMRQKRPEHLELIDALPRTGPAEVATSELRRRFDASRPEHNDNHCR